jgi:hypothetical protein
VFGVRKRLFALLAVFVIALSPTSARADTLCEDGWLSPSDGGRGTCSWHGGIAGNDDSYDAYDTYGTDGSSSNGAFGRILLLGGGAAIVAWLARRGKK